MFLNSSNHSPFSFFSICKKLVVFSFIFLSLEIAARLSSQFMPLEIHQKYFSNQELMSNGRGARSPLYEGQPIQMAVIGESPVLQEALPDDQIWTAKLQQKIGKDKIHIDNFGIGYNKIDNIILLLESFLTLGRDYDIILIEATLAPYDLPLEATLSFYYSYRWFNENSMSCHTCLFVKNWFERRWNQDHSNVVAWIKSKLSTELSMEERLKEKRTFYYWHFRQSAFVKDRLIQVNKVELYSEVQRERLRSSINRVNLLTKELGADLIWAPVRLGYHTAMRPSYYEKTISTAIAPIWTAENPVYYNEESHFWKFEQRADETKSLVQSFRIDWIDYMKAIQNEMIHQDELMVDEFHPSATGSDIIASKVEEKIQPIISQRLIKNRNK